MGARERAEKLAASADEILARYEQAVRDVRAEAEQARRAQRRGGPQPDLRAHRAGARRGRAARSSAREREVASALAAARTRLRAEVEPLAREAASRVLGRVVS